MAFINLTSRTLNEAAIALIDWNHKSGGKDMGIRVSLLVPHGFQDEETGRINPVHLYFPLKSKDAEILRSHFGLPHTPPANANDWGTQDDELIEALLEDEGDEVAVAATAPNNDSDIPF